MKQKLFSFVAFCIFTLLCLPVHPDSDTDFRTELHNGSRQELLRLGTQEVPPSNLGDWRESIDSTLFMLFRHTELFRGPLRIMIIDDNAIFSRLYPEGIMIISTGLLDYIDLQVFELTVNDPRRARDYANERERMIMPFLAYNVARFALDLDFISFKHSVKEIGLSRAAGNFSLSVLPSKKEIQQTDQFAQVLISLAGYDSRLYGDFLIQMQHYSPIQGNSLSPWFDAQETPANRLIFLEKNTLQTKELISAFSVLLQTLRTGTAYPDALSAITELRETVPNTIYLSRLEALILHQYWLSSIPAEKQVVKTIFPFASENDPSRQPFMKFAKSDWIPNSNKSGVLLLPRNEELPVFYYSALLAYERFLSAQADPSLSSTYAMLLFLGGKESDRALEIAESAARLESQSKSFLARNNYASLLFLSGTNTTEAVRIMNNLSASLGGKTPIKSSRNTLTLDIGMPADERDLLINHAIMFHSTNDRAGATKIITRLESWEIKKNSVSKISLRGISIGDTTTELINRWGHPESIGYNYYTEIWKYPKLGAEVSFTQPLDGKDPSIARITLYQGSPISPRADIRTGDSREYFEQVFGKPLYRSGDRDVYCAEGTRISVYYLFERIRSITVDK